MSAPDWWRPLGPPGGPDDGNPYLAPPVGGPAGPMQGGGGATGPSTGAAGGDPNAPGAGTTYAGEDEFVLGPDQKSIYQRIRVGFRTVGWKPVGSTDDLTAAAAAGNTNLQVLTGEMTKQLAQVKTAGWENAQSSINGMTNQDVTQANQGGTGALTYADNAWKNSASGYGNMTQAELARYNQGQSALDEQQKNAWQDAMSKGDPTISNQTYEQNWQGAKDAYGARQTAYETANQGQQQQLDTQQRQLGLQTSAWSLGHLAQTQAQDAIKLNDTGYQQQQGMKDRDLGSGYGYAAMAQPQKLVGQ